MKINFLNGNLVVRNKKTGVHYFHENIMRELKKNSLEFNSSLFDFKNKNSEILIKEEYDWIRDCIIKCNKLPRFLTYLLPIELFFGRSDIYVCDGWMPITNSPAKKVAVVHDLMVKIFPENYSFIMKTYLSIFFKKIKKADAIVTVSQTTKNDIIKYLGYPEEKIHVIYCGVDEKYDLLKPKITNDEEKRVDLNKKYLFYIGDMRKNKNLLTAVKAFDKLYNENKEDIYFYIAGRKAYQYEEIAEFIKDKEIRDRVIFLGYVSDEFKIKLYQNALCFIFISLYEGFGIPIIEAMKCGTPVITSNCSSMKEIAGESALLVEPNSIKEIVESIKILEDEEERTKYIQLGKKCAEGFTWEKSAQKMKQVLLSFD